MRRASRTAEPLTEFVALLAREVQHRRRISPRRSQSSLAAEILEVISLPDLGPAIEQLRAMALDRALDGHVKPARKRPPGLVVMLDQPA